MSSTMSASEARAALPEILDRVRDGEEITVTRHGQPVAIVVRPDTLRSRRASKVLGDAQQLGARLDQARKAELAEEGALNPTQVEGLVAEVRASRKQR
jgi:prevent-host-death family protein